MVEDEEGVMVEVEDEECVGQVDCAGKRKKVCYYLSAELEASKKKSYKSSVATPEKLEQGFCWADDPSSGALFNKAGELVHLCRPVMSCPGNEWFTAHVLRLDANRQQCLICYNIISTGGGHKTSNIIYHITNKHQDKINVINHISDSEIRRVKANYNKMKERAPNVLPLQDIPQQKSAVNKSPQQQLITINYKCSKKLMI